MEKTSEVTKRGLKKEKQGVVVKAAMQKTVVVSVNQSVRHERYGKFISKSFRFMAHDEKSECGVGDTVIITETRPLSANKRWRVTKIISKSE